MSYSLFRFFLVTVSFACLSGQVSAQLTAYGGKSTDNNCKLIHLVNPSPDSIYYVGQSLNHSLNICQTYLTDHVADVYLINVTTKTEAEIDGYLLLLPKDTITYQVLIPDSEAAAKQLQFFVRNSDKVINTFDEKKLNRRISKLPGRWMCVNIIDKL